MLPYLYISIQMYLYLIARGQLALDFFFGSQQIFSRSQQFCFRIQLATMPLFSLVFVFGWHWRPIPRRVEPSMSNRSRTVVGFTYVPMKTLSRDAASKFRRDEQVAMTTISHDALSQCTIRATSAAYTVEEKRLTNEFHFTFLA